MMIVKKKNHNKKAPLYGLLIHVLYMKGREGRRRDRHVSWVTRWLHIYTLSWSVSQNPNKGQKSLWNSLINRRKKFNSRLHFLHFRS